MSEARRKDRSTVFVIGMVVVVVAAYWGLLALSREYVDAHEPGSSYDVSAVGTKVWFDYLDALGLAPQRLERFDVLPDGATIIAPAPLLKRPDSAETGRVATWVREGGRLVLVGAGAQDLAVDLGVDGGVSEGQSRAMRPILPGAYAAGVESIDLDGVRLHVADVGWAAHYKDTTGQGLLSQAIGEGEVVWLAGTYPVSNEGIGSEDNARLAVALAAAGGRDIYFDEYHHGYVTGGGIWDRLGHGGRAAMVLGIIGLALLALGPARRLGAPIREPAVPAARTGAYTSSLAELYRRAGARREALETLEDGLKRVVTKRRGSLRTGLDKHPEAEAALEHSTAVRTRRDIDEKTFMEAIARLSRARREVEGRDG